MPTARLPSATLHPDPLRKRGKGGKAGQGGLPWIEIGILVSFMVRGGYLSAEDRADLIGLARDGSAAHRVARRANALVLLDDGWSCERVAAALFVDDETVRRLASAVPGGRARGVDAL